MVIVETIGRVRRDHFVKGKTINEIARNLKISRNTVRKVLRSEETSFSYDREVQPRPKLENWSAELDRLLTTNAAKSARKRLTLIRIFEELRRLGYAPQTAATIGLLPPIGSIRTSPPIGPIRRGSPI
jgi:predicted transcriptional regulator